MTGRERWREKRTRRSARSLVRVSGKKKSFNFKIREFSEKLIRPCKLRDHLFCCPLMVAHLRTNLIDVKYKSLVRLFFSRHHWAFFDGDDDDDDDVLMIV